MKYHSSEFPISWFADRKREGNLILEPPFQRRLVWKLPQKSHLIESILMDFPVPEIYIQQTTTPEGHSTFGIVDGQQRISAMLAFVGLMDTDSDNGFSMKYLEKESDWRNLSWEDLTEDQKTDFYRSKMAVRILDDATDEEVRDLFRRLNKYLTKLSDQELRNATYSGPLVQFSLAIAEDEYWSDNKIVTAEDIRRMKDIEFISELVIGALNGPQAGSTKAIDDFYELYEELDELPQPRPLRRRFQVTWDTIAEILPDIRDNRWHNKTDYYSLFVSMSQLLKDQRIPEENLGLVRDQLNQLESGIATRLASEEAAVTNEVIKYVRAVEKGSSDRARRGARHEVLTDLLSPFFVQRHGG